MRALRLLTFIFLFCVDVHVKAETVHDCWDKKIPCAIKAKEKRTLQSTDLRLSLAAGALLEQRDEKTIQLVLGHFYVETARPIGFKTPYARLWCQTECKALFERSLTVLEVKSLEGDWRLQRTGEAQTYVLPAGFQVRIGEVDPSGKAQMEFPQSLPWTSTVNEWAALYPGKTSEFKPTLVKFRALWRDAVEAVSDLHQKVVAREIASQQKTLADERAHQLVLEREDKSLRDMFRDKNP